MRCRLLRCACGFSALLLLSAGTPWVAAPRVQATDRVWNTNSTGSFTTTTNWTPAGLPTNADKLTLRRGSMVTYSVTFLGKVNFPFPVYEMDQLRVGSNIVTFSDSLTGLQVPGTVNVTNASTAAAPRGIIIADQSTDTTAILKTTLAHFNAVAATIGEAPNSFGQLEVVGGAFTVTGSSPTDDELIVGNQGNGHLYVSGAQVNVSGSDGNIVLGKLPNSVGYAEVNGGAALNISAAASTTDALIIGQQAPGSFNVGSGAHVNIAGVARKVVVASSNDATSDLTVFGAGSQFNHAGILQVGAGGRGTVNVLSGGLLSTLSATIDGLGFSAVSPLSTVRVNGAGSTWNNADDISVGTTGYGYLEVSEDGVLSVDGLLTLEDKGILTFVGGTIMGNLVNRGVVGPGDPGPGVMTLEGDYSQSGKLTLRFGPPMQSNRLMVDGDLHLANGSEIFLASVGALHDGDSNDVLDWTGNLTGQFTTLTLSPLLPGLVWNTSKLYTTGVVSIETALTADFDADADVDFVDLALLKGSFGTTTGATHLQGDADRDGDVDGADFLIWQRDLGKVAFAAPVPEPTAALLAAIALAAAAHRRMPSAWSHPTRAAVRII